MNIYDVSKAAGVSPATVSRVLNGSGSVKEETKKRVERIIQEMNYVPNVLARNLSNGHSQNIAFIVPDIKNPFFATILHGISEKAQDSQTYVFMFGTDEDVNREHNILDSLSPEMIQGIIVTPVSDSDHLTAVKLEAFEEMGIPVVLIDRDIEDANFDGVFSEDRQGAKEAIDRFIDAGHERIAIITGVESSRPGRERLEGYKSALQLAGIPIRDEYIVSGYFQEDASYQAMEKLMSLQNPPTALFTSNNLTTLGVLHYMKDHAMKVVKDISLIGFDDIRELSYTDTQITVVTRPVLDMGYEVMNLLEERLEEKLEVRKNVMRKNFVMTSIISRGSEYRMDRDKSL